MGRYSRDMPTGPNRPPIPDPPYRGGCLCGAVRYSFSARPRAINACHCRDCQKLTGATNLLTVYAPRESFVHEQGKVDRFRKRADSGRESDYFRCASCGCRLWHEPLTMPQFTMVAAGTLDDPSWAVPATHIWTSRALAAAAIPEGVATWELGPADRLELIAEFEKVYPGR